MVKGELAEWIAMLAVIAAWWPLLLGWGPAWYRYPLYVVSFAVLIYVFIRRWGRMQAGLRESENMLKAQRTKDAQPLTPGLPSAPPTDTDDKDNQTPE